MASYVNDLRLKEIGTGESSGTWGSETNTNLELIGDALGFGTEAITTNADTHTTTVADGSADAGRAMYIKYTGALDSACTITIGPNTINRMHFIENATTGSQNIIISQGTGSNVTIPAGDVKAVYLDGAGSGAAVADAFTDLNLAGTTTVDALNVSGALTGSSTIQGTTITATTAFVPDASDGAALGTSSLEFSDLFLADAAVINLGDDQDTTLTHVADTGILLNSTRQLQFGDSGTYIHQSADGVLDLVSDTEIEINATTIDMNGAVDISGTVTATGTSVFASLDISGDIDVDGTTNLDVVDIDGAVDMASTLQVDGAITSSSAATITTADNNPQMTLVSTDADANVGPVLKLYRNSSSPADNDLLGRIQFTGEDDAGNESTFARINVIATDVSNGSEDARMEFAPAVADDFTPTMSLTSGKLGIGTTSPDSPLEIDGGSAANTVLHLTSTTANTFLKISDSNTNEGNFIGCTTDDLTFFTRNSEKVRIDSTGKVGFGESSPSQNLDVKSSTVNTGVLFYNTNTTSGASVPLFLGSEAGGSTTNVSIENAGASNTVFRTGATSKDAFGSERMRITSAGLVGLGTTSPGCLSGGIHAVHANAEGTPTFDGGEVLILQRNFNSAQSCSMSMVAGTNAACTINMGDKDDVNRSFITSHQGTDTMGFTVATGSALEIVSGRGGGSGRTVSATGNGGLCFGAAENNTGGCLMAAADNSQSEGIVFYLTASASEWQPASIVAHCSKIDTDQSDHNYGNVAYGFSILGNGSLATVQKYEENPSGGAGITWSLNDLGGTTTMQIQILATSSSSTGPRIVLSAWAANYSGVLEANRS